MKKKNAFLIKNTIIFAISNFATKFIAFFLVPIYTKVLIPSEFGVVDLLYTICSFVFPLITFNISDAILRFSLDTDSNEKDISNIAIFSIFLSVVLGLLCFPIFSFFPSFKSYSFLFYLYLVTLSACQILLVNLKGQEKLKLFSLGNILYTFLVAIFNILFLVFFKFGINGYFIAYILANFIISIYSIYFGNIFKAIKDFKFNKKLYILMIKYSVILIPSSFMWWIMNFADRVMVTKYSGLHQNGIYGISYKLPTLLSTIASIFTQAWLFSAIKEKGTSDEEKYTNDIFNILYVFTLISSFFIILILKPFFKVYVDSEYFVAWQYVPILIVGYIYLTLATFISTSYNVNKDSKGYLFSSIIGAIINIILNFILIPLYGVFGAAVATSVSYIAVFIYRIIDTSKYVKINLNLKFYFSSVIFLLFCLITYTTNLFFLVIKLLMILTCFVLYKDLIIQIMKNSISIVKNKIK